MGTNIMNLHEILTIQSAVIKENSNNCAANCGDVAAVIQCTIHKSNGIFTQKIKGKIFKLEKSWKKFCEPYKNIKENVPIEFVMAHHAKIGVLQELLTD